MQDGLIAHNLGHARHSLNIIQTLGVLAFLAYKHQHVMVSQNVISAKSLRSCCSFTKFTQFTESSKTPEWYNSDNLYNSSDLNLN